MRLGGLANVCRSSLWRRSWGITLSVPQAQLARQRLQESGLNDRCRVEVSDYRDVEHDQYDKIVSVGMFEHVGEALPYRNTSDGPGSCCGRVVYS